MLKETHRGKMRAVKTEKRVDKGLKMKGATFNEKKVKAAPKGK